MGDLFCCERCGNRNPRYIGHLNGKPYCRRCISFSGVEVKDAPRQPSASPLVLHYPLSPEQKDISDKIRNNCSNGINTLVYAVCGAGKTELVYGAIADCLRKGGRVAFAVPRRDVVIELYWRLKDAFPEDKVIAVYGGHTNVLLGDVVVLTTHQLYRYPKIFDLLVMDEIDAFPYRGDETLAAMAERAARGSTIVMSATPSAKDLKIYQQPGRAILELRTRFHKREIPIPKIKVYPYFVSLLKTIVLLRRYQKERHPVFVFAPTISECEKTFRFLRHFVPRGAAVHSQKKKREEIIRAFKRGKYKFLVTTSVLERGVTVKNLQVIVLHSDREDIYDSSTLIQIAGRVGRKFDAPGGDVWFFAGNRTPAMERSVSEIKYCNTFL